MSKFRNWIATYNNPPLQDATVLELIEKLHAQVKAKYTIGQLEKGKEEGTLHLQLAFNFKNAVRPGAFKGIPMWTQGVNRDNGIFDYASKADTRVEGPFEFGERPIQRNNKTDWEQVFEEAKAGNMDAIPAQIKVQHYRNLQAIRKDHMVLTDSDDVRGVWIHGQAGVGKSRFAREQWPDSYPKSATSKFFCGYTGQKTVIMDDIAPEHKYLGYHLKIWADRYGCILETKGGAVPSNFDKFIITSQYSPEEVFAGDERTLEAIRRRFRVVHMITYD